MSLSRDLFAAARTDAPPPSVHDEVWGRVVADTSAPVAAGTAAAKAALLPSSTVVLAVATIAVALGVAAWAVLPERETIPGRTATARTRDEGHGVSARLADDAPRARAPRKPEATTPAVLPPAIDETSDLAEEARLVTEARAALMRGEADRAYALSRRTRTLGLRALEPEELALEARALRALGRVDEALAAELTLRRRYPNHALSR